MSRARNKPGWGIWYLVSNRFHNTQSATVEYGHRFGCEEGFRDAEWWLGFKEACIGSIYAWSRSIYTWSRSIYAWSRMFALVALALLVVVSLGSKLLLRSDGAGRTQAICLLRRVASRRRGRWELSLVSAVVSLLRQDKSLWNYLSGHTLQVIREIEAGKTMAQAAREHQ